MKKRGVLAGTTQHANNKVCFLSWWTFKNLSTRQLGIGVQGPKDGIQGRNFCEEKGGYFLE